MVSNCSQRPSCPDMLFLCFIEYTAALQFPVPVVETVVTIVTIVTVETVVTVETATAV